MRTGLRLLVYDQTFHGNAWLQPGLTSSWIVGAGLYRGLSRIDRALGASSWAEALAWLGSVGGDRPVDEIQYWGHGKRGGVLLGSERLDAGGLAPAHEHHDALARIRDRLSSSSLWWFRTCETFGGEAGHDFARAWTTFFRCRAAGHTYVIGPWQSGLHSLAPGASPHWPVDEGAVPGRRIAKMSTRTDPHTISFLHGTIPADW